MSLAAVLQEANNDALEEREEEDIVVPIDPAAAAATSGSETVNNGLVSEHEEDTNDAVGDNDDDDDEEDDESEYEYEDEDETAFGGFLDKPEAPQLQPARIEDDSSSTAAATSTTSQKVLWKEPSQAAVNMSLRAEQETTGGKRRLASDLYKIMTADTDQAGFSLEPKCEDSMKHWTIKLFQFDEDSNLAKDLAVLSLDHVELEMSFPDQYPFEPPFCRVVRPKFKKQSGFVMNGALCMELLTKDGWNPVNDIESVIVSIRSLLVVGDGRVQAAVDMGDKERDAILARLEKKRKSDNDNDDEQPATKKQNSAGGSYSMAEAQAAYTHLSDYHKKKGWDKSGWWRKKG